MSPAPHRGPAGSEQGAAAAEPAPALPALPARPGAALLLRWRPGQPCLAWARWPGLRLCALAVAQCPRCSPRLSRPRVLPSPQSPAPHSLAPRPPGVLPGPRGAAVHLRPGGLLGAPCVPLPEELEGVMLAADPGVGKTGPPGRSVWSQPRPARHSRASAPVAGSHLCSAGTRARWRT